MALIGHEDNFPRCANGLDQGLLRRYPWKGRLDGEIVDQIFIIRPSDSVQVYRIEAALCQCFYFMARASRGS